MTNAVALPLAPPSLATLAYVESNGLAVHLARALELAARLFSPVREASVQLEIDPESDEEAIVIDVATDLPPDVASAQKRTYTREWVASVPPDVNGRVRVLLDLG